MTQTPEPHSEASKARETVDRLEDEIVDVDEADSKEPGEQTHADDRNEDVSGSEEPPA